MIGNLVPEILIAPKSDEVFDALKPGILFRDLCEGLPLFKQATWRTSLAGLGDRRLENVLVHGPFLQSYWIYRRHEGFGVSMNPSQMPRIDFKLNSMHELVTEHQEQLRVRDRGSGFGGS